MEVICPNKPEQIASVFMKRGFDHDVSTTLI